MKIRVIQLINNYFKDKNDRNENREKALGEYCTFGYFDALRIEEGRELYDTEENLIWKNIDEIVVNTLDGTCNRRNLVCIVGDEKKDEKFWHSAAQFPYLFVSLIRMQHDDDAMKAIHAVMEEIRKDETVMLYYSYNHSELVIAKCAKSYREGIDFVLSKRKELSALNMYSIFSVRENILKLEKLQEKITEEEVKVRLRMMIKDDKEIEGFLQELWEKLFVDGTQKKKFSDDGNFKIFYTLGSSDIVVEIEKVRMCKLLSCYGMGNLLTHTNERFEETVYNIETEIMVKDEVSIAHGESVDS